MACECPGPRGGASHGTCSHTSRRRHTADSRVPLSPTVRCCAAAACRLRHFCQCRPARPAGGWGEEDGESVSQSAGCCSDPAVCPCAREGVGCHVEGGHYCQCGRAGSAVSAGCGNPCGLYEFDEWGVRQHALQVLYGGGGAGGEDWGGAEAQSPSTSPSASPSPHHSASPSLSSASSSSAASFLTFRSHSFSFHPPQQHGGAGGVGLSSPLLLQLSPSSLSSAVSQPPHRSSFSLSRRSSRVSPPSSPLLQQSRRAQPQQPQLQPQPQLS